MDSGVLLITLRDNRINDPCDTTTDTTPRSRRWRAQGAPRKYLPGTVGPMFCW